MLNPTLLKDRSNRVSPVSWRAHQQTGGRNFYGYGSGLGSFFLALGLCRE